MCNDRKRRQWYILVVIAFGGMSEVFRASPGLELFGLIFPFQTFRDPILATSSIVLLPSLFFYI